MLSLISSTASFDKVLSSYYTELHILKTKIIQYHEKNLKIKQTIDFSISEIASNYVETYIKECKN